MQPERPTCNCCSHKKALWALFWRMLVFGPLIGIFGALVFIATLILTVFAPILAIILVFSGDWFWSGTTFVSWLTWLRFGGPVRQFVFEGFEHASL